VLSRVRAFVAAPVGGGRAGGRSVLTDASATSIVDFVGPRPTNSTIAAMDHARTVADDARGNTTRR